MKSIRFLTQLSVIALFATAHPVIAQPPPGKPVPGLVGAGFGAPTGAIAPPPPSTFSCEVPMGPLATAVEIVTRAADAMGIEMPNILFAPKVGEMSVPALKLRSVKPSGVLSLLAAAAGCDVEQVVTPDTGEVSGWMFKQKPPLHSYGANATGGNGGFAGAGAVPNGGFFDPNQATPAGGGGLENVPFIGRLFGGGQAPGYISPAADEEAPAAPTGTSSAPTPGPQPGNSAVVIGMGGGVPASAPVTRVYAVGSLLDQSKPDSVGLLVTTLENVLAAAAEGEKERTRPNLSFHDGTKLLVAKATSEAQALIEQTLQAMKQNANDLKAGGPRGNEFRPPRQDDSTGGGAPAPRLGR